MLGLSQSRGPKLFGREIIFEEFQHMCCWYLNVADRRTDRQTDGRLTVALPRSALASRGKKRSKHANTEGVYFAYVGRRNPWTDHIQILFGCRDPGRNHVYQIWWGSVKGFLVGRVPKFALSHWLWWSSLQQCYATACTVIEERCLHQSGFFGVGQFNGVVEISLRPTLVTMVTNWWFMIFKQNWLKLS